VKQPQYKLADKVFVHGKQGTITEIHSEASFFMDPDHVTYEYTVKFEDGIFSRYSEAALSKPGDRQLLCQCGAWVVHWAPHHHSRWCPAYNIFDSTQEERD
jgi:hypothetical protein